MYCRGAAAVILTYDVTNWQSLVELEHRFLSLTDTANSDCIFAIVGNKADLTNLKAAAGETGEERESNGNLAGAQFPASPKMHKQVQPEDAMALYRRILRYKMLEEKCSPPAEAMCFETSAKTGYNVDLLFERVFDMVVPGILKKKTEAMTNTVDLEDCSDMQMTKLGCCG